METGVCPAHEIVCVVIDEAHKATGNHAYVQVASMLSRRSGGFRILALSATPGQNVEKIQEVVTKLRIHRLEARDETSIDVMGCINERVQHTLKLPLEGDVAKARDAVGRVYSLTLRRLELIHETDIHKMPRFLIIQAQQKYMAVRPENVAQHVYFRNAACFSIAIMMSNAYELVSAYGCGSCLNFLDSYLDCGSGGAANREAEASDDDDDDDSDDDEVAAAAVGVGAKEPRRAAAQTRRRRRRPRPPLPRAAPEAGRTRAGWSSRSGSRCCDGRVRADDGPRAAVQRGLVASEARGDGQAAGGAFRVARRELAGDGLLHLPVRCGGADAVAAGRGGGARAPVRRSGQGDGRRGQG